MKGILLAGGSGSRLYPLTTIISKQLLPVYDKPMICYPLTTLMSFGIRDILIISTPQDTPNIEKYLGNGEHLGIKLQYEVQDKPNGIAEAFILGENFIQNSNVCLILGDNIFYMDEELIQNIKKEIDTNDKSTVFGYHVSDPERYGVVEFDSNKKVVSIEEKPKEPKSNFAVVGLYFYTPDVVKKAKNLKPSARNELEITDINKLYLQENKLNVETLKRGTAWLDAGTPDSLLSSSNYVEMIEKRQGIKIGCPEEIAYKQGFISKGQLADIVDKLKDGIDYKKYLQKILKTNF
ncbi:MAG: glucose-1-phosphate thymidylyltransferase RfbA [Rickettsiales bacterium]|jgi:glucose-1-phosphate thymidylyltransferase|nr:glucose-1-phosphate thymidylyltransferase RfbA [Rickettsiales bacterium]